MLSVKNCRELLGATSRSLAEEEVEELREQLYSLANLTVAQFVTIRRMGKSESNVLDFRTALNSFMDAEIDSIEERAAVIEFDGNLPRDEAERAAIAMRLRGSDN